MIHYYIPDDTPEPSAAHIAEREAAWLDEIETGDVDITWRAAGDLEWSDEVRVRGLAPCVTPPTARVAARLLDARLPSYDEAVAMIRAAAHFAPRKVTRRGGPMAFATSASDLAIRLHSDALAELPDELVDNRGKLWLAATRPTNFGWVDPAGPNRLAAGIRGWQSPGTRHNDGHVDCSQTLRVVRSTTPPEEQLWDRDDLTLAERVLAWLGYQFGLDPREIPGPVHEPLILGYSEHCRRGGRLLGVDAYGGPQWDGGLPLPLPRDEDAWCAALVSASLLAALLPGEVPPHGLRVSVRELVEDAGGSLRTDITPPMATGAWRDVGYVPRPGDRAIYARAGQDPRRGGTGHVRTVVQLLEGDRYLGVGGNERDAIRVEAHPMRHPDLRGWLAT